MKTLLAILFLFVFQITEAQKPQIFKATEELFSTRENNKWSAYVSLCDNCPAKEIKVTRKAVIISGDTIRLTRYVGSRIAEDHTAAFVYTARDKGEICHVIIVKGDAIKEIQIRRVNQRTLYR
jgi:hypothetical protein